MKQKMWWNKERIWWPLTVWDCENWANVIFLQEIVIILSCYVNCGFWVLFVFKRSVKPVWENQHFLIWKIIPGILKILLLHQIVLDNNECHCRTDNDGVIKKKERPKCIRRSCTVILRNSISSSAVGLSSKQWNHILYHITVNGEYVCV